MVETITTKESTNPIFKANLFIFLGYYILAIASANLSSSGGSGIAFPILMGGYMVHAGILILISIMRFIQGLATKTKTNAGQYFLAALALLIIGFGACTFAFFSGVAGGF